MANRDFFPQRPDSHPVIYAYTDSNPSYKGLLKVGYTTIDVDRRVAQQYPTKRPDGSVPYSIVVRESAIRSDGTTFTDRDVHKKLRKKMVPGVGGEWFRCTLTDLKATVVAIKNRIENEENRTNTFSMRPEQEEAVIKTIEYYETARKEFPTRAPKFLWNAKMRFGKTFASYQLAKRMGMTKILVLTFKPAVESAWSEDLLTHIDFEGWQLITRTNQLTFEAADHARPIVCFGSFQDYLGTNETGGIKVKNSWVHETNWDIVIFDEYHFGAWRDNVKKLFEQDDDDVYDALDVEKYKKEEADNAYNETFLPITTSYYLFLSGTPFRAISSGEFIEDQIYNWTYSDEQRAKENWGVAPGNIYASLPRMVMMTYKIPESIRHIAIQGEFDEFDLNVFFSAKGKGKDAKFAYENEVQKWLDLIRGSYLPTTTDDLKLGSGRPPMPYSDTRLLNVLSHTFWFLPNVASCQAMKNLLGKKQNVFFHDYTINVCAGAGAGIGLDALVPVLKSMEEPLESKTITLSCGKLTTGVTVRPWTGIFMLRNLSSPETYFQAAFRVQNPWEIDTGTGTTEIIKHECYVFDFALDRALKQISDYSCRLNIGESNPEKKVAEFINFLPVIAYDGSTMRQIDAGEILDIAMAGTSATLLAKRWESALLVNVDNDTLARLMANKDAMHALMSIEGFRSLNSDIQTIINKSEAVKKTKKENGEGLTPKEKKKLTAEEKEYKSKRKEIQDKLIKFATRIPIFMYLTDYREYSLEDIITQLEPGLFKKVTGLNVNDFELLVSLNVFNRALMNDAVYKFKRYEDSSLSYTGVNKHEGEKVGLFDTVISIDDYKKLFNLQQRSLTAPPITPDDELDKPYFIETTYDEDGDDTTSEPMKLTSTTRSKKAMEVTSHQSAIPPTRPVITSSSTKPATPVPIKKEEKPKIDCSSVKIGSALTHKMFGAGTVVSMKNGLITVAFTTGEKRFQFPEGIENGFLTIG
jgi:hypothetical protein